MDLPPLSGFASTSLPFAPALKIAIPNKSFGHHIVAEDFGLSISLNFEQYTQALSGF